MSIDDLRHGILTVIMITFYALFVEYRGHIFASGNILNHCILKKTLKVIIKIVRIP